MRPAPRITRTIQIRLKFTVPFKIPNGKLNTSNYALITPYIHNDIVARFPRGDKASGTKQLKDTIGESVWGFTGYTLVDWISSSFRYALIERVETPKLLTLEIVYLANPLSLLHWPSI